VIAIVLAWRLTPLAQWLAPDAVARWFEQSDARAVKPLVVLAAYVLGGLIAFPVTVLIAATAIVFGPARGFLYAMAGSLASAGVAHLVGARIGRQTLQRVFGPGLERAANAISRRGVLAIATVRLIPVAPYTVVNLVAGAIGIPWLAFMAGTALGMLPGIVLLTLLGDRLRGVWEDPRPGTILLLVLAVALWIGISLWLNQLLARRRR
jgi:uncharacterized membrane protein YdjX (TVP38/TMEM64 family)